MLLLRNRVGACYTAATLRRLYTPSVTCDDLGRFKWGLMPRRKERVLLSTTSHLSDKQDRTKSDAPAAYAVSVPQMNSGSPPPLAKQVNELCRRPDLA